MTYTLYCIRGGNSWHTFNTTVKNFRKLFKNAVDWSDGKNVLKQKSSFINIDKAEFKTKPKPCWMCGQPTTLKDGFCRNNFGGRACKKVYQGMGYYLPNKKELASRKDFK